MAQQREIEPFLALALALRDRGHTIIIASSAAMLRRIEFWHFSSCEIAADAEPNALDGRADLSRNLLRMGADADLVVMPATLLGQTRELADELRKPVVVLATTPSLPLTWQLTHGLTGPPYDRRRRIPQLHVYSTTLFPRPSNWPALVETAGYVTVTPARKFAAGRGDLAPELVRWLDSGPPPVALAYSDRPAGLTPQQRVAHRLGQILRARMVVSERAPPFDCAEPDENVYFTADAKVCFTADADEDRLFARCRAVVHDGSAGTSMRAARAGVPAIICAAGDDERMWGQRLRRLGIADYLPLRALRAGRLARAVKRLDTSLTRRRVRAISSRICAEDGIPAAVAFIERIAREHAASASSRKVRRGGEAGAQRPQFLA